VAQSAMLGNNRTAYIALIRSKLAYSLLLTFRNFHEQLEKLQTKALQVVTLTPKGTPGKKLRALLKLPSMMELAQKLARSMRGNLLITQGTLADDYEYWVNDLEGYRSQETPFGLIQSATLVDDTNLWFDSYQEISRKMCRTMFSMRPIITPSIGTLTLLKRPLHSLSDILQTEMLCFCDGGFNRSTWIGSTGVVVLTKDDTNPFVGGSKYYPVTSSFQSEVLALRDLLFALHVKFKHYSTGKKLRIFTDSRSLVQSLTNWTSPWTNQISPTRSDICRMFAFFSQYAEQITIEWIPGHKGIVGNELADAEATRQLTRPGDCVRLAIDQNFFKHSQFFKPLESTEDNITFYTQSMMIKKRDIFNLQGPNGASIVRMLLAHHYLKGCHLQRSSESKSGELREKLSCRWCKSSPETLTHVISECPAYEIYEAREKLLFSLSRRGFPPTAINSDSSLKDEILATPVYWRCIISFFSSVGVFP
jgi:ribonuclease HI